MTTQMSSERVGEDMDVKKRRGQALVAAPTTGTGEL
jgi:hypothetical protein